VNASPDAIAAALRAESIRFDRPKADRGVVTPELWIVELGSFSSRPGRQDRDLCIGKGSACLVDPDDPTSTVCAEVVVARRLAGAGYDAGWLNTYKNPPPAHWTPRFDPAVARDRTLAIHPALRALIGAIGTPDVFGSRPDHVVFVEVKRRPDQFSAEQAAWFEDALASGVTSDALFVANWTRAG
jgi:hypothetical protein